MPKVSVNILTKNRAPLLKQALLSVSEQSFKDYEVVVVNDGSTDNTDEVLQDFKISRSKDFKIIKHEISQGIIKSRQEALLASSGEYVAVLDDDDRWIDADKLKKQVEFLDKHPETVLCGGGIEITKLQDYKIEKFRPKTDKQIRNSMLFRNNFFTSTVMFRRAAALHAGGFINDGDDFAEDYDLWLRLGKLGKMYNFQEPFTAYRVPEYNKARFKAFLAKQSRLIAREKGNYPAFWLGGAILRLRQIL